VLNKREDRDPDPNEITDPDGPKCYGQVTLAKIKAKQGNCSQKELHNTTFSCKKEEKTLK
jgi:hypothetical protein